MNHVLALDECKGYASEANLDRALAKHGLDHYTMGHPVPCRYIKCLKSDGKWTAIFLVSEFFRTNKTGGYIGFAGQHGFMSV
jgi:hypothetical protein